MEDLVGEQLDVVDELFCLPLARNDDEHGASCVPERPGDHDRPYSRRDDEPTVNGKIE